MYSKISWDFLNLVETGTGQLVLIARYLYSNQFSLLSASHCKLIVCILDNLTKIMYWGVFDTN